MSNYDIIIRPVITEKSMDGIVDKKYAFIVRKDATKTQIRHAVESIFNVTVDKINTVRVNGKIRRRGVTEGKTASYKKAYVSLTADSKAIEFFESLS